MPSVLDQLLIRVEEAQARVDLREQQLAADPYSVDAQKNLTYALKLLAIWEERVRYGK